MASPCDTCSKPGSCCKGFILSPLFSPANWERDAPQTLAHLGVPFFRVVEAVRAPGDEMVAVRCDCDRIGVDGRCTDYENRPSVCRDYSPLSDPLCCEYVGPPPIPCVNHFAYPSEQGVTP